jgi:hypothetical protein
LFPRAIGRQLIDDQRPLRAIIDGLLAAHERVEDQQALLDGRVRKEAKAKLPGLMDMGSPTSRSPIRSFSSLSRGLER